MSLTKPIPKAQRDEMAEDPFYSVCCRPDGNHQGRITWEHAITYAGRRINDRWAIIPLCMYHHGLLGSGGLDKTWNRAMAMHRATSVDRDKYPRMDWGVK